MRPLPPRPHIKIGAARASFFPEFVKSWTVKADMCAFRRRRRRYANSPHAFSQFRNFNIKFSECNSSHIGDFLSTTSRFRDKRGTGPGRFPGNRCHAAVFAAAAKTHPPRLDAPAAPLQEDWRARHGDLPSRPLNWDCEKRARERPPAVRVRRGISPAW